MGFLRKIVNTLTTEVKWGRLALLALGASIVALLVSGGAFNLLALTVFAIVGIFNERVAPRHPYLNAFCYGLLGVLFYTLLFTFQALGAGLEALTAGDVLWGLALPVAVVVMPQALIGTWIGVSIRRFSRVAAEARQAGEGSAALPKAGPADRQAAPPPEEKPAPPRRKKKG